MTEYVYIDRILRLMVQIVREGGQQQRLQEDDTNEYDSKNKTLFMHYHFTMKLVVVVVVYSSSRFI